MFLNSIIWSPSPFQHWILKYLQIFKYLPFLKAQEWRNYYCWEGASLFLMAIAFSIIRRAELSVGLLKELILAAGLISLLCWAGQQTVFFLAMETFSYFICLFLDNELLLVSDKSIVLLTKPSLPDISNTNISFGGFQACCILENKDVW